MKLRAGKAGVELPPTPAGVRERLQLDSPGSKRYAEQDPHKHQEACSKKAGRAEKRGLVQLNAEHLMAQNRQDIAESRAQSRIEEECAGSHESDSGYGPLFSLSPFSSQMLWSYEGWVDPPARMVYCGHPHPEWYGRWRLD
jgi:hypothetical protein